MNNTKEARELNPNQDLKINAGLMQMWKKAGLRIKSFKATKKGHNEIWAGKFKSKNAVLEMSVDKYGNVFYHAGNKSVNIGKLDKQRKIIEWMKAIIRNAPWAESVNEGKLSEDYKNSEWEVYVADENGKEKIVKKAKSKRAGVILYNKLINSDKYHEVGMRVVKESVNEATFDSTGIDWSGEMMWKWVSKALKSAGIKELKYTPMKSGWLGGKFVWGGFYKVQANKRKDVLPFTVDKKGNLHLNVSPKKFIIGKIGKLPQVVKNLKDFKKSDLDVYESVNEDIVRGNEVHAKTKKELKAAIARSMKEILTGKTPKYDIINGMTGEMIGWKDGKEYIWQPHAIPDAMRELK